MEIDIQAHTKNPKTNQFDTQVIQAVFTMVATDANTRKAAPVNPLTYQTDEEKVLQISLNRSIFCIDRIYFAVRSGGVFTKASLGYANFQIGIGVS